MYAFNYQRPKTVRQAAGLLAKAAGDGKLLAGGQTLLPTMKQRLASPAMLIDLGQVEGMSGIELKGRNLHIGAMTKHADVATSLLLHENFADVTQVPFVAPDIAPSVLGTTPPPLEVVVSETSVSLHRDFPPAPLPEWQAEIVGCPLDAPYRTEQSGFFPSPAAWVDHWDAQAEDGSWIRLRFTHLVTPIDESSSRLLWAVSRDFALGNRAVDQYLEGIFTDYYDRVIDAMEIAQEVLEIDGPGPEVNVNADAVGLKIREIVSALLLEEGA